MRPLDDPKAPPDTALDSLARRFARLADRSLAWVRRRAPWVLAATVALQVGVLLAMVAMASRPVSAAGSRTVRLTVVPVDPRDLLRGDYVTLSYDVSRVPVSYQAGATLYVRLTPTADDPTVWTGAGETETPPGADGGGPIGPGPYLRGTVVRPGIVEFGLEKYFVPEGQGVPYENAARSRRLRADVAVAPDGQAGLLGLVVE